MKFYDPQHRSDVIRNLENVANTLTARMGTGGGNVPLVLYDISHSKNVIQTSQEEKSCTITARMGTGGNQVPIFENKLSVRRLTPVECERLQGLPDNYTDVAVGGKPASDGARYKAIGNGMAQPCADFIIKQIVYWTEE